VIDSIRPQLGTVKDFVLVDGKADGYLSYEDLLAGVGAARPVAEVADDDVAWIIYTSGTTGRPKGAMLTHRGIFTHAVCYYLSGIAERDSRTLYAMPAFHVSIHAVMAAVLGGGTAILMKKFEPEAFLQIIEQEKITTTGLAPTMINFVVNHPNFSKYDLSSLRQMGYGAAPMPVDLLRKCVELLGPIFVQVYGQTESNGILTVLPKEDHVTKGDEKALRRLKSCGKEWMLTQVRIVNEEGEDVAPGGEAGEIIARGDIVMKGYLKQREASEETLEDGWLHTGDMGWIDEDGYIYIVDRKKDMIISGGENIYPKEIEDVIYTHPAVSEAAVIGVPDEVWGESVKAVISVKPGMTLTSEEVIDLCKKHLASYKKPKSVDIRQEELPKNPSGKILKTVLRGK
jgi:acyl-CoA synthetase (AMP-forming)/AMP-acid ligase II